VKRDGAHMRDKWGIEIVGITLSAAGYMLDLRYRIVDAGKAEPLVSRGGMVQPYLVDQSTGSRLLVPGSIKTGSQDRNGQEAVPGRVYDTLFANPSGQVKPGSKVTVVLGEFRAEDLVVQ